MLNRTRLSHPPRVLIASDQDGGLRDLESFLSGHGYFVVRVYAGTPVLERARAVSPDVIVLDAKLADRESLDLSRRLREDPLIGPSLPILLLVTAQPAPQDHLVALRAGIWELLPRPLNHNELLLKMETYVLAKVEADRAPKRELVDPVTGLYTSQGLARRARELVFQASQHNTSAACVVFTPALAERAESSAELLLLVGQTFQTRGRRSDAIGRVGSGLFAVVAPGTDAVGAVKLAERLRHAVPATELRAGYDAIPNVRYAPVEANDLLAHASRALQLATAEGKWIRAFE